MKILVVSHEYPPLGGGGANACMNLTEKYVELGHEVVVLTAGYQGVGEQTIINGVKIIRLPTKRVHMECCNFGEMLDYLIRALYMVGKLEKKERFHICQVFFAIPSGPIGLYLKKRFRIPYIIRFGGGDIPGFQKRFKFVYKFIAPFEIKLWKEAFALVANSKGLKKMAESFWNKKEITVIPNGARLQLISEEIKNGSEGIFRILFVSRLIERKGLQFIIPQLLKVKKEIQDVVKLIIVGDGPYRGELEKMVKEYMVEDMVEFVGQKGKKELPYYYANADLFIFPSQKEGMPNAVLEAMASGLPIIMTACEGSEELIDGNGYIVSVERFSEKIVELYNNSKLRDDMGKRSVELIKSNFLWNDVAMAYEDLFREAILDMVENEK